MNEEWPCLIFYFGNSRLGNESDFFLSCSSVSGWVDGKGLSVKYVKRFDGEGVCYFFSRILT